MPDEPRDFDEHAVKWVFLGLFALWAILFLAIPAVVAWWMKG